MGHSSTEARSPYLARLRPQGWARLIAGEVGRLWASAQVRACFGAACKTVGFAFPGSNPGPATTSGNALELAKLSLRPILPRAAGCGQSLERISWARLRRDELDTELTFLIDYSVSHGKAQMHC